MKKILFIILLIIPFVGFGQSMDIRWNTSGIEFSINPYTGELNYTVPSGDIEYIKYSSQGPVGSIKSVGDVDIEYIKYSSQGPVGSVKSVGNLDIEYIKYSSQGPVGSVKETSGSVY